MSDAQPSNVLFVVLDTVRKDHLTPYGYDRETTPGLEEFAAEATVFENAVSPAPWTLPVHASMFTGRYPSQHGADQQSPYLDGATTLAESLSAAGFDTACYSSNAWITPYTRLTAGFDDQDNFFEVMPGDFLSGPLASGWQRLNDSDRLRALADRLVSLGNVAHEYLASGEGAGSKTPAVIERTKEFVERSEAGEFGGGAGWFAFLNLMDAHLPYHPPAEYAERFAPGVDSSEVCQNSKEYNSGARDIDESEWEAIRGLYDAEIAHIDAELTRLFDWLRETDRWEDTAVVVCADHGELHGEHDLYGHEFALYDPLVNVPLVVKHPALPPERRTDLVELLDCYHTVLDAFGVEGGEPAAPGETAVPLDRTRSLLSDDYRSFAAPSEETETGAGAGSPARDDPGQRAVRAAREAGDDADYAFVEYPQPAIELRQLEEKAAAAGAELPEESRFYARMRAARGRSGKYVRADRIPDEGYRVDEDPGETTPLAPGEDGAIAAAERALAAFEREVGGAWDAPTGPAAGDDSAVEEMDAEARERLRDLGYLE